jgi:hypothetical protein
VSTAEGTARAQQVGCIVPHGGDGGSGGGSANPEAGSIDVRERRAAATLASTSSTTTSTSTSTSLGRRDPTRAPPAARSSPVAMMLRLTTPKHSRLDARPLDVRRGRRSGSRPPPTTGEQATR